MSAQETLGSPFTLPCGVTLRNRFIKAAMTEQLSDQANAPTEDHVRLYQRWGRGGSAALLTGNVMVDPRALEGPRNVAVEDERDLAMLTRWADTAQENGAQLWMQISHPGRQTPRGVSTEVVAPSAIAVQGSNGTFMARPRALAVDEIQAIIARFARTAAVAKEAGFAGIQLHGAHGYLISQFLTPRVNQREDEYGGPLENRMRMLLETIRATRDAVGAAYPISLKLNSADFQRGGFSEDESMEVVRAVAAEGIELLEISGGNYENPKMIQAGETAAPTRESTAEREAFFLDYARKVRAITDMPLMLTGGLRTASVMASIIDEGHVDVVGLARPLALDPDLPNKIIAGATNRAPSPKLATGIQMFDDMLQSFWYQEQMTRMAREKEPDLSASRAIALAKGFYNVFGP